MPSNDRRQDPPSPFPLQQSASPSPTASPPPPLLFPDVFDDGEGEAEEVGIGAAASSRSSFSYHRLPEPLLRLSVLKLDGSSFDVRVAGTAAVWELKVAIEDIFCRASDEGEWNISWCHVWGHFCLCYKDRKLTDEKAYLRSFGIKDGDQVPRLLNSIGKESGISFSLLCWNKAGSTELQEIIIDLSQCLEKHGITAYNERASNFKRKRAKYTMFDSSKLRFVRHLTINYNPRKRRSKSLETVFELHRRSLAGPEVFIRNEDYAETNEVYRRSASWTDQQANNVHNNGNNDIDEQIKLKSGNFFRGLFSYAKLASSKKMHSKSKTDSSKSSKKSVRSKLGHWLSKKCSKVSKKSSKVEAT